MKVNGKCYSFQTDPMRYEDAISNCQNKNPAGRLMSIYKDKDVMDELQKRVNAHVAYKMEKGYWWLGMKMDDFSRSKPLKDRE